MKTMSSVIPKTYEIEIFADNTCDVIFATNVTETEVAIEDSEEKETQYSYDMYRLHMPYSETLSDRIGENYTTWLAKAIETELSSVAAEKTEEVREACQEVIYKGIDFTTAYGDEHFSLDIHDQQNLSAINVILSTGVTKHPYHADGKSCVMYTADDLSNIIKAGTDYITYHTTYCNMLRMWINRETDIDVLNNIHYGSELPADLKEYMEGLL